MHLQEEKSKIIYAWVEVFYAKYSNILLYRKFQKFTLLYVGKLETKFLILFGKHLADMRRQKNISQEQLSFDADVSLSTLSKIERGVLNVSISNLYKISKALKVHHKELFDFDTILRDRK